MGLQVGLLNPITMEYTHAQSDEVSTIGQALSLNYICHNATVIQNPATLERFYLGDAIRKGLLHPDTGKWKSNKNVKRKKWFPHRESNPGRLGENQES